MSCQIASLRPFCAESNRGRLHQAQDCWSGWAPVLTPATLLTKAGLGDLDHTGPGSLSLPLL